MMMSQSKNVHQLVWHLRYIDTAVEGSELYFYNTEGNRNSVVSQVSCRMDVTRACGMSSLEHDCPPRDRSVQKRLVPHGFHKLIVAFSSISPLPYSYFDVVMLF